MSGLLSIAPVAATRVTVQGAEVPVYGLSLTAMAELIATYPALQKVVTGRGSEVDAVELIKVAPGAIKALIAQGTGHDPSDDDYKDAERIANRLPTDDQIVLLKAVIKETLPNGLGALVQKLEELGALMDDKPLAGAPSTKSRSPRKS